MLKKLTVIGLVIGVLVMAAAVVGAQDNAQPIDPQQRGGFDGPRDRFDGGRSGFGDSEYLAVLEQYTGLTLAELNTELIDNGQTVAQLVEANGESVDDFITAVSAPMIERVDAALAAGRIDSDQADTMKANITERLTEQVNTVREAPGLRMQNMNASAELVEQYTGQSVQDVMIALRDGATLADLITANGESVDDFIAAAVAEAEAAINERTAQAIDELPDRIRDAVEGNYTNLRGGMPFDGPRGGNTGGGGRF